MRLDETFERLGFWPLLLLVPVGLAAGLWLESRRRKRLDGLVAPSRARVLYPDWSAGMVTARAWLGAVSLLLFIGALLDPVWGTEITVVEDRGIDMMVCLDVSRSMLARDVTPSRLARARREIEALADRARGDRMGCVAFAGESRLVIPLTHDMDTFRGLVENLDVTSVPRGGSDVGRALDACLTALDDARGSAKAGTHEVILLLTDGEDLEKQGLAAARRIAAKGITIHAVGFGGELGSNIVTKDDQGKESFVVDDQGKPVVSTMDSEGLRAIAKAAEGEFLRADAVPLPLLELYTKRIVPMAKRQYGAEERENRKHRFQWPLLGAVILSSAELAWIARRRNAS
jgi:Ca-activated chloride channel family protein